MEETYGIWEVTTNGDCEGRTSKVLGIFEGHIDDIALSLSDEAVFYLYFKEFKPIIKQIADIKCESTVSVMVKQYGVYLSIDEAKSLFKNRPVTINNGCGYYSTFGIKSNDSDTLKRAKALAKLSDDERKILGL